MGFLSNYDIKYLLRNGFLEIKPRPKMFGPMSIDLAVKDVFLPTVDQLDKIFPFIKDPAINIDDFFFEGRILPFDIDSLNLEPLSNVHEWYLQKGLLYIIKHREEIKFSGLMGFNIYTRSRHARTGIHSLGIGYDGKYCYEIFGPYVAHHLSKLDRISQLILVEPGTNYLEKSEIEEAVNGKHIIVTRDGKEVNVDGYPNEKLGFIPLTLADEVKYYPPEYLEQLYSPERFVDGKLSSHSIPEGSFVLGISNERVNICNEYVGALPHHVHKNFSLEELRSVDCRKNHTVGIIHCSSPFHQPGSDGHLIFEIPDYNPNVISAGMYIPLRIGKMTTPSSPYDGKFLNQSHICL
jgi:deoxycytidine triphosphate deaminase